MKNFLERSITRIIFNTDFEKELCYGDKLKISKLDTPTISDYTPYTKLSDERIKGDSVELPIDFSKYYKLIIDDVETTQNSADLLNNATFDAGQQLAIEFDKYVFDKIAKNGTEQKLINTLSIKQIIARIGTLLDKENAPLNSRFIVINPDFAEKLLLELSTDLKENNELVTNGFIGSVFNFKIFKSNNIDTMIYGCFEAGTSCLQLAKTETLRNVDYFGDVVRGLSLGGFCVTRKKLCGKISLVTE